MLIRPATAEDWPAIWPILRDIGRARGHSLDQARAEGYRAMQFNAVVETNTAGLAVGLHIMYLKLSR